MSRKLRRVHIRLTGPTDELFVASSIIPIQADQDAKKPLVLEIFASEMERCQGLREELVMIDR
jgi:hypothetical protein